MKFSEIYHRAIEYWPDEIYIGDGIQKGDSGYLFPTLSKAWDSAKLATCKDDEWLSLSVWCMFQSFHAASKQRYRGGDFILKTRSVPLTQIESRLAKNLQTEGWEELLLEYENDLSSI